MKTSPIRWIDGQAFAHIDSWECVAAGMYGKLPPAKRDETMVLAAGVLESRKVFINGCKTVFENWPISSAVHLTNDNINQLAWLGQAACCVMHAIPEEITRLTWNTLSEDVQYAANKTASAMVVQWKKDNCQQAKRQLELTF